MRPPFFWALALAFASVVQVGVYIGLSHRSSWFQAAPRSQVAARPTPDFRLGTVDWPVSLYAVASELEPFREEFRRTCEKRVGVSAAICISDTLARQFQHGNPTSEFFDSAFDPVAHLRRHTAGEPGHCVSRSAILASELLANGIPARVAQLIPAGGRGHNVVEVWDEGHGWVVVDPTYAGVAGLGSRPSSALELLDLPHAAKWYELSRAPAPSSLVELGRRNGPEPRLFGGDLVYPEPWLYLRVGSKRAPRPFRGTFVYLTTGKLGFGTARNLLRFGILLTGLGSIAALILLTRSARSLPAAYR